MALCVQRPPHPQDRRQECESRRDPESTQREDETQRNGNRNHDFVHAPQRRGKWCGGRGFDDECTRGQIVHGLPGRQVEQQQVENGEPKSKDEDRQDYGDPWDHAVGAEHEAVQKIGNEEDRGPEQRLRKAERVSAVIHHTDPKKTLSERTATADAAL